MRSPSTATSACLPGAPLPSITRPLRNRRSCIPLCLLTDDLDVDHCRGCLRIEDGANDGSIHASLEEQVPVLLHRRNVRTIRNKEPRLAQLRPIQSSGSQKRLEVLKHELALALEAITG